ncbi:MAG: hypothetical protein II851_00990 [Bacteroidales bacterium]|nr:hypothetical protein [Bacteroidales bacterium]
MLNKPETVSPDARAYLAPAVIIIPICPEDLICESPLPGGNEGIGFENWN